jgi:hypothetical protein
MRFLCENAHPKGRARPGDGGEGLVGVDGDLSVLGPLRQKKEVERKEYTLDVMSDKPKSAFELAMERLKAEDREAGTEETRLSPKQKDAIAEARRVASSRLAEREILFKDAMKKTPDPAEREKAESEYHIDRQRIHDDCEKAIEAIRRGKG